MRYSVDFLAEKDKKGYRHIAIYRYEKDEDGWESMTRIFAGSQHDAAKFCLKHGIRLSLLSCVA